MDLSPFLRDVPDFPKPGIVFKDISPLLADPTALRSSVEQMAAKVQNQRIDRVVGIESRGFIFGVPLAVYLKTGFAPIRKPGKLPWKTRSVDYILEYGSGTLEIHEDAVRKGERVLLVDDLLATGGTMRGSCELVERLGGQVVACVFAVELAFLEGRKALTGQRIESLVVVE